MNAGDLVALIRKRYEDNAHIVLEQVPNGTGMLQTRWIDAAVFCLWPSKGLTRAAFEIKVSRSDFIAELQNFRKHQWVRECFHEFWFVAPQEVIQIDELPNGVGWMYPHGRKLRIKKHCTRNYAPKLDDLLLAAFMRAAHKEIEANSKEKIKSYLADDKAYQGALFFQEAVGTFLKKRNQYLYDTTPEGILEKLEEATLDKEVKQDREHLLLKLGQFQRAMASLFNIFAIIANRSLIARNGLGEFIVSKYGGDDEEALSTLKDLKKQGKYAFNKKYADLIDTIMNWDKEFKV